MQLSSHLRKAAPEVALWIVNLAAVFWVCRHLFGINHLGVFWGWDPSSMLAFLESRHRFSEILFGVGSDPVIGLGNIAYPLNQHWFPSFMLSRIRSGTIDGQLAFAIGATELFASIVLCGRAFGIALAPSLAAGWLVTLTTWNLFGFATIATIWSFFPNHAEVLAVLVVMASGAFFLGEGPARRSILFSIVIFLGLTHTVLALPTSLVLTLPVLALLTAARLLSPSTRGKRRTIVLCWVGIGLAALALGYVRYVAGMLAYTAAGQFTEISKRPLMLYSGQVTILLWTPITWSSVLSAERILVGGGLIGCLAAIWLGSPRQREIGWAVAFTEGALIAVGASNYRWDYWFGPSIWYYESYLFPFFSLLLCFLPVVLIQPVWRLVARALPPMLGERVATFANLATALVIPLAIGLHARSVGPAVAAACRDHPSLNALATPLPQPETEITRILKAEVKLSPGAPFRGRVAVMTGRIFPEKREWQHYANVHYLIHIATGNLHDGPGLWQDDIPTLMEYNTLMTPVNYAFLRGLLAEPKDLQIRNILGLRHVDPRILGAIGVRFVITDLPIPGLKLRARTPIPVLPKTRELLGYSNRSDLDKFDLYLYELDGVNLGQFSPIETKVAPLANQALRYLADSTIPLDGTVVVSEPLPGPLVHAKLEQFTIGRDRYHVRASSTGRSVLLLPIEYSHCLEMADAASSSSGLFRADLLLTGVRFERRIDADISFHAGPFANPAGRLQDLSDVKAMQIRDVFRDRPEFNIER